MVRDVDELARCSPAMAAAVAASAISGGELAALPVARHAA